MNKEAGRGGFLFVTLRLENGETLPFVVDTGSPATLFEKSQDSKLGKRVDTISSWNFGAAQPLGVYVAPKLFLGRTQLQMTGTNVYDFDSKKLSFQPEVPIMGILGMDVLGHYCIQLDFVAGKMRFLTDDRAAKKTWGNPFPLTDFGNGCFFVNENLVAMKGPGSMIDTGFDDDGWLTPGLFQLWTNQTQIPTCGETRSPNGVMGGETYLGLDLHRTDEKSVFRNDSNAELNGIGLHVLSRNLVTLDFPNRTMYLKRTSVWPLIDKDRETIAKAAANSVVNLLKRLKKEGRLPGWSKHDRGTTTDFRFDYPGSVTVNAVKKGDPGTYHYQFVRASKSSRWKCRRAWRTDKNDHSIREYSVP
jgi:hypothetical protein